jgi:GNAT superfamily N-acetyltransferase
MIEIREGDKQAFFRAPFEAYGKDSLYVTPMWTDVDRYFDATKNPLFMAGNPFRIFTAHRDGRPIGRICAHLHRASNERHKMSRACFGYFDVADDAEAADALLNAAMQFAREQKCSELAGNFNLTAMQQIGVTTGGFENQPYTDMTYSPPHISQHLSRAGFEPFFPATTWEIDVATCDPDRLLTDKSRAILKAPEVAWMPIDRKHFAERLEDARNALNAGFDPNPMFVPVSKEEYHFQAAEMMWILDPRLSTCVHIGGKVAGVILCIPDLNPFIKRVGGKYGLNAPFEFLRHRLTRKRAVGIYYSVVPEHQGRGLNAAMLYRTLGKLREAGYTSLGITWIADVNGASLRQMERVGARQLHRQHLFRKAVA